MGCVSTALKLGGLLWLFQPTGYTTSRGDTTWLLKPGHKVLPVCLAHWSTCTWSLPVPAKQPTALELAGCEEAQTSPTERPHGEAPSLHRAMPGQPPCSRPALFQLQPPTETMVWGPPNQNHPAKHFPNPWPRPPTHKLWEVIKQRVF